MKIQIKGNKFIESAEPVLRVLRDAGYQGWLVGGCVRETVRQNFTKPGETIAEYDEYTDIDIATCALPEKVIELFSGWRVIETGVKHGTVTVLTDDQRPVEVTTFRADGEYTDNRHPDKVEFVPTIDEDLSRRDFTVNAMAMNLEGEIKDPFGGMDDLSRGIIRAVGDPERRFKEDGLRILRALRFASALDFTVDKKTETALHLHRELLKNIAAERLYSELKKMLCGKGAGRIVREFTDVLTVIIPEIESIRGFDQRNPYHRYDVLEHCIRAMEAVATTPENREYMKLMALLHDIGKPETFALDEEGIGHFHGHAQAGDKICRRIMNRLKADRFTRDRICWLVHYHDLVFMEDDRILKRWMRKHTPQILLEILAFKRADNIATGNATAELLEKFDRIRERIITLDAEGSCFKTGDLAVDGRDLIRVGVDAGPEVGRVLEKLLDMVIEGSVENDRKALLDIVEEGIVHAVDGSAQDRQ